MTQTAPPTVTDPPDAADRRLRPPAQDSAAIAVATVAPQPDNRPDIVLIVDLEDALKGMYFFG